MCFHGIPSFHPQGTMLGIGQGTVSKDICFPDGSLPRVPLDSVSPPQLITQDSVYAGNPHRKQSEMFLSSHLQVKNRGWRLCALLSKSTIKLPQLTHRKHGTF